jgi:hypothetical protein
MIAVVDITNLESSGVLKKCGFVEIEHELGEEFMPLMGLRPKPLMYEIRAT